MVKAGCQHHVRAFGLAPGKTQVEEQKATMQYSELQMQVEEILFLLVDVFDLMRGVRHHGILVCRPVKGDGVDRPKRISAFYPAFVVAVALILVSLAV